MSEDTLTTLYPDDDPSNSDWIRFKDPYSPLYKVKPDNWDRKVARDKRKLKRMMERLQPGKTAQVLKDENILKAHRLLIDKTPPLDYPVWEPLTQDKIRIGHIFRFRNNDLVRWAMVIGDADGTLQVLTSPTYPGLRSTMRAYGMGLDREAAPLSSLNDCFIYTGDI